jgi:hypothetical protein
LHTDQLVCCQAKGVKTGRNFADTGAAIAPGASPGQDDVEGAEQRLRFEAVTGL